jgi:predicted CopG family antitoxin
MCCTNIEFSLYLPYRLQEKYGSLLKARETFTEKFKIRINCSYFGIPITFIELIDPTKLPSPSDAVMIIRKFFEDQIPDSQDNTIRFESLGPSPFHVDVYLNLEEGKFEENNFADLIVESVVKRGYDFIKVYGNTKSYKTLPEVKKRFIHSAGHELCFYYLLEQMSNKFYQEWQSLKDSVNELLRRSMEKGLMNVWYKLFYFPQLTTEAVDKIAQFEINRIEWNTQRNIFYRQIYKSAIDIPIFKSYIDDEINNLPQFPIKELSELITFVEKKRLKGLEFLILIAGSLFGGIIGTLLTLWLKK